MGDLTATLETTHGDIEIELYDERVPTTVQNFVNLAEHDPAADADPAPETPTWEDPETGETRGDAFYQDTPVHRIIDGFMVQMGDPTGTGRGGPGYTFDDEFDSDLGHDGPGVVSMANSGPNTNGSQFFITFDAQPHLDGDHAVFGEVIDGMDTLEALENVDTGPRDEPEEDVRLEAVRIND